MSFTSMHRVHDWQKPGAKIKSLKANVQADHFWTVQMSTACTSVHMWSPCTFETEKQQRRKPTEMVQVKNCKSVMIAMTDKNTGKGWKQVSTRKDCNPPGEGYDT